jgi:rSAM/selenodomain-associated transferase 1
MNRHLIVFVKNPELGKVKTRIAATAGDKQALAVYLKLLEITQRTLDNLACQVHIYYSSFIDDQDLFNARNIQKSLQADGDLGEKMSSAFHDIFNQKPGAKVVIMGSDCPDITSEIISEAFESLENHHLVVGPTFDGGYYCLGMDAYYPEVFKDIVWSSASVFNKTIQNAEKQNLSYHKLPTLHDIDHEEDWITYQSRQNPI